MATTLTTAWPFFPDYIPAAASAMNLVLRQFHSLFPLAGGCSSLVVGRSCSLYGGNPVRTIGLTSTSFTFLSLPGHSEGAGKHITFRFYNSGTNTRLSVTASGPDNTFGNSFAPCAGANNMFASIVWGIFANQVGSAVAGAAYGRCIYMGTCHGNYGRFG